MNLFNQIIRSKRLLSLWNTLKRMWSIFAAITLFYINYQFIDSPLISIFFSIFVILTLFFICRFIWQVFTRNVLLKVLIMFLCIIITVVLIIPDIFSNVQKMRGLLFSPAHTGEVLIIVATFDCRGGKEIDISERIISQLTHELATAETHNIRIERAPKVHTQEEACRVCKIYNALLVIWGWYDTIGLTTKIALTSHKEEPVRFKEMPSELADFNLHVRIELPDQITYLVTFIIGIMYYEQENYDEALDFFNLSYKHLNFIDNFERNLLDISTPELYIYRGNIFDKLKLYDSALVNYTNAIEIDTMYAGAYNNRGLIWIKKEKAKRAFDDFSKAISIDQHCISAYQNRGTLCLRIREFEHAVLDFTKALSLDPYFIDGYISRGWTYLLMDEYDMAINDFSYALSIDPKCFAAYLNRAITYNSIGKNDMAIADCSKAIKINPLYAEVFYTRATAYFNNGNYKDAVIDIKKAISLSPYDIMYLKMSGFIHMIGGQELNYAIENFRAILKQDSTNPEIYDLIGVIYTQKQKYDSAVLYFNKALKLNPNYDIAFCHRGYAYYGLYDSTKAIADFEKYLVSLSGDSDQEKIIELIKELKKSD